MRQRQIKRGAQEKLTIASAGLAGQTDNRHNERRKAGQHEDGRIAFAPLVRQGKGEKSQLFGHLKARRADFPQILFAEAGNGDQQRTRRGKRIQYRQHFLMRQLCADDDAQHHADRAAEEAERIRPKDSERTPSPVRERIVPLQHHISDLGQHRAQHNSGQNRQIAHVPGVQTRLQHNDAERDEYPIDGIHSSASSPVHADAKYTMSEMARVFSFSTSLIFSPLKIIMVESPPSRL